MNLIRGIALMGMTAALLACQRETILPGERLDPRAVVPGAMQDEAPEPGAHPLSLPRAAANADWPQRGGGSAHLLTNPAIGAGTTPVWSVPIGQGNSKRYRLVAEPVVAGGRVFTLDSHDRLSAVSTSGALLWTASIAPPGDRASDATGSGLAYADGKIYVTSGYGELIAYDASTGNAIWRQRFDAGVGGAPTVADGTVYVLARDASAWAIRAADGKVLWQISGAPARAGMGGASAPVIAGRAVIFPFATGELMSVLRSNGMTLWTANVAGRRLGRGYTLVEDLTGEPVVSGNVVYAGSSAGKLSAFDLDSGDRLWTAASGPNAPVQVAGGSLFIVNDNGRLQRLDAATGRLLWSRDLPYWETTKVKKQNRIWVSYGPVLAGGKLFVPCSDGVLRVFDPATGKSLSEAKIPGGAATDPVVAGGTLYLVSGDGVLRAYR